MNVCKLYNATIANLEYKDNPYYTFDPETKTYSGASAYLTLDFYLMKKRKESQKEFFKYCNFVTANDGFKLENGSYTGLFQLVIENKAEFVMAQPYNMYMDDILDLSSSFGNFDVVLSHFFDQKKSKINDTEINFTPLIDLFIPDILFFIEYILLFAISWISISCLFVLYRKYIGNLSFKTICLNVLHLKDDLLKKSTKRLSCFKIALLFNLLFLFFIKQILENNVNTSKIIVNKEILIYDEQKIYTTKLRCCWLAKNHFKEFFKGSLKGSLGHYIYYNKTDLNKPCYLTEENNVFNHFDNYFTISYKYRVDIYMRIISALHKEDLFINKNPLLSLNLVIYISKSTNKLIKNEIDKWGTRFTHYGFQLMFFKKYAFMMRQNFPSKTRVYESVSEFIDDKKTLNEDLKYQNFSLFFYIFITIDILIVFFYILKNLISLSTFIKS